MLSSLERGKGDQRTCSKRCEKNIGNRWQYNAVYIIYMLFFVLFVFEDKRDWLFHFKMGDDQFHKNNNRLFTHPRDQ